MTALKKFFNQKNIKIILLVIVVVLLAGLLYFTLGGNRFGASDLISEDEKDYVSKLDKASEKEDEGNQIFYIRKSDVYKFEMTDSNDIILTFEKNGDDWVLTNDPSLDMDEVRIDKVLNYITDVRIVDTIVTENADEYGINAESPTYIVTDDDDFSTIISLGNVNKDTGEVYFTINYDFSTVFVNSGKLSNVSKYSVEDLLALN